MAAPAGLGMSRPLLLERSLLFTLSCSLIAEACGGNLPCTDAWAFFTLLSLYVSGAQHRPIVIAFIFGCVTLFSDIIFLAVVRPSALWRWPLSLLSHSHPVTPHTHNPWRGRRPSATPPPTPSLPLSTWARPPARTCSTFTCAATWAGCSRWRASPPPPLPPLRAQTTSTGRAAAQWPTRPLRAPRQSPAPRRPPTAAASTLAPTTPRRPARPRAGATRAAFRALLDSTTIVTSLKTLRLLGLVVLLDGKGRDLGRRHDQLKGRLPLVLCGGTEGGGGAWGAQKR